MRVLTQGAIEEMILQISDALEEQTYLYSELSDTAADAEATYKECHARALVAYANDPTIGKITAAEREARVDLYCSDVLRSWKVADARRQSTREALLSLRARLDALRTLSANVRHQT